MKVLEYRGELIISTRSRIGYISKNGNVKSIYCHFDGYPDGVGKTLYNYYKDLNKIKELISLGSISSLAKNVQPNSNLPHSFDGERQEDVTVAYHRDRGEGWKHTKPITHKSIDAFEKCFIGTNMEYAYLFDERIKQWIYSDIPYLENEMMDFQPLKERIEKGYDFDTNINI